MISVPLDDVRIFQDREHAGQSRIVMLEEDDADHAQDWVTFWELLGGKGPVAPALDDDAAVCALFLSLTRHAAPHTRQ